MAESTPERGTTHTDASEADILGMPLTQAIDAYIANQSVDTLRTFSARLIEQCARAGTSYAVLIHERLDKLEARNG